MDFLNPLNIGAGGGTVVNTEKLSNIMQSSSIQDRYKLALGLAAGPLGGLAFNMACLGGINLYQYYKKERTLKKAFENMKKDPLGYNLNHDYFIYKATIILNAIVNIAQFIPYRKEIDGYRILECVGMHETTTEKIGAYCCLLLAGLFSIYSAYFTSECLGD